ncbi:FAD-binding oxidoreductase [Pseudomonadota bacterium]
MSISVADHQSSHSEALAELGQMYGDKVLTSQDVCERHGKDESFHPSAPPDAVIMATATEQVADIVRTCARHKTPVIAYGTGTSLEGQVAALTGGVCIDLSEMNQIIEVHAEDLDVEIQAGVRRKQLNAYLKDTGLFFPVDPGADASLGGMAACRASGTNTVRYGAMRENVLAMTVVLADGRIIRTSRRARKSAAGYDLTRLFVGSEGTLGVITELTLRLYGIPEAMSAAICHFSNLEDAVNTTILTIQSGIPVARIELLDDVQIEAVNTYSKLNLSVTSTLLLEFHGSEASVEEQAKAVQEIAKDFNGSDFEWSSRTEERNRLWQARHDVAYAGKAMRPDGEIWATDVCVPISRLADCIMETKRDIEESKLVAPIVGHVGDGNFHLLLLVDHSDAGEVARAQALHERMVRRALSMGGTCTGEHGIGYGKMDFLEAEHGQAVDVMRSIKQALDPDNIMNPGKMLKM